MREDWKAVLGYEGHYEVNSEGVIRSIKFEKVRILKPTLQKSGYYSVPLSKEGKVKRCMVHRLVWEAFNGPIPEDMLVLHGEGNDRTITRLDYLRLGTKHDNQMDRWRDGSMVTNLSTEQVIYIKQRANDGMAQKYLCMLFGVNQSWISRIKNGYCWSHLASC